MTRVSVIVPTRALSDDGRRCLEALLTLPEQPEVIFVPDVAPSEGTLDPRVIVVESGPRTWPSAKRQLALAVASGDVIALIDDDAVPHRSWLTCALSELAAEPHVGAVCGPSVTPATDGPLQQAGGLVFASLLVSGPTRWRHALVAPRYVTDAPSCNLVLRRSDAVAVGLHHGVQRGEDTALCQALLDRGRRIRYRPDVIVFHSRRPLYRPHLRQLTAWARTRGGLARARSQNSLEPGYFAPSLLLLGLLSQPLLPGRLRALWRFGALAYVVALVVSGGVAARGSPRMWARVSTGIAATNLAYGAEFLHGFLGGRPPELPPSR